MPTNWPPVGAPAWPPPEAETNALSCSNLRALVLELVRLGFTQAAPTSAENAAFFTAARCDHGHTVLGRMLVAPGGTRYPFAVCTNATHRDLLVLWPPYFAGFRSGLEE